MRTWAIGVTTNRQPKPGGEMARSLNLPLLVTALLAVAGPAISANAVAGQNQGNLLCSAPQDPKALEQFHDCAAGAGCYSQEQAWVLSGALRYLDYRLDHPHRRGEHLAIVVDIDDTALSNYAYLKEMRFVYDRSRLEQKWKEERIPAIPDPPEY
jgi:hypothetical protein